MRNFGSSLNHTRAWAYGPTNIWRGGGGKKGGGEGGGGTEFRPNGEHNLFVTRPLQGEKLNCCSAYFLTVVDE